MATNYPYVNSENLGTFKECLEAWVLEQLKNYDLSAYETVEAAQKAHDELVEQLEAEIAKKQDILTAGTGIDISGNVVSCTLDTNPFVFVDELPTSDIKTGKVYCTTDPESTDEKNIWDEWYWIENEQRWEAVGKYIPTVDLTPYQTKEEATADKSELEEAIKAEQEARETKETELEEAISALETADASKYETKEDAEEAHATLQESLENEGTARSEADDELSKRLDELAEKMNELTGDTVKWVTSEEGFLLALVDNEDSLLLGITKEAKVYFPVGILDGIVDSEKSLRDVLGNYVTTAYLGEYYYTAAEVDQKLLDATQGEPIDLSGYLTKQEAAETYQPLGDYATKGDLPTKTSELTNDSGFLTEGDLGDYAKTSDLPTDVSQLTNDSGYITSAALADYAKTEDVPTKVSDLENDSGFITETQADEKYLTDDDKITLTPYTEDEIRALFDE